MQYELTFGNGTGSNPGQFNDMRGILAMPGGIVYVCDKDNHRVQKMADNGTVLAVWGTGAPGSGERERTRGHRSLAVPIGPRRQTLGCIQKWDNGF